MDEYGVQDRRAARQIERRKEELIEREERDYGEGYHGGSQTESVQQQMSDDQISSMFKGVWPD
jgi:hypothetical protein